MQQLSGKNGNAWGRHGRLGEDHFVQPAMHSQKLPLKPDTY
jgi:hypothetical protein